MSNQIITPEQLKIQAAEKEIERILRKYNLVFTPSLFISGAGMRFNVGLSHAGVKVQGGEAQ